MYTIRFSEKLRQAVARDSARVFRAFPILPRIRPWSCLMSVHAVTFSDLDDLSSLFAGYLEFYQVPRPLAEIRAFLEQRLDRGDSTLFIARDYAGTPLGFTQLYPFLSSLALAPAWLLSDLYVVPA